MQGQSKPKLLQSNSTILFKMFGHTYAPLIYMSVLHERHVCITSQLLKPLSYSDRSVRDTSITSQVI
jgi:hypothetical protein